MDRIGSKSPVVGHGKIDAPDATVDETATKVPTELVPELAPIPRIDTGLESKKDGGWVIEHGRVPVFGARSVDGTPPPRAVSVEDGLPISVLMGDLNRRVVPLLGGMKDVERLISEIGLRRAACGSGERELLASHLRRAAQEGFDRRLSYELPGTEGMEVFKPPLSIFTRHVLAETLCASGCPDGTVDLAGLRRRFGSDADRLVSWIGSRPTLPPIKQHSDAPFEQRFIHPETGAFPNLRRTIVGEMKARLGQMELLSRTVERYGFDVADDMALVRQHGFLSVQDLCREIAGRYVSVDKNYSASLPVKLLQYETVEPRTDLMTNLVLDDHEGAALIDDWELGQWGAAGDVAEHGTLLRTLKMMEDDPPRHFHILDEGGRFVLKMHDLLNHPPDSRGWSGTRNAFGFGTFENLAKNTSAVEHTVDGIRQIREKIGEENLLFPVVNAAESPLKLMLDSILCGWSVVEEMERTFQDLEAQGYEPQRSVMVVGYGSMGRMIARLLHQRGYDVTVKEVPPEDSDDPEAGSGWARADTDGFPVVSEIPPGCDVQALVGTTGLPWFDEGEVSNLKSGTVLFSSSSSNKEWPFVRNSAWSLVNEYDDYGRLRPQAQFEGRKLQLGLEGYDRTHWHRVLRSREGQELLLANSGYPIDFTGAPDSVEALLIQLVRSLMLYARFEAQTLEDPTPGIHELSSEGQIWLATEWMQIVRNAEPPVPDEVRELLEEAFQVVCEQLS